MKVFTRGILANAQVGNREFSSSRAYKRDFTVISADEATGTEFFHRLVGEYVEPTAGSRSMEIWPRLDLRQAFGEDREIMKGLIRDLSLYLGSVKLLNYVEERHDGELAAVIVEAREGEKRRVIRLSAAPRVEGDDDAFPLISGSEDRLHSWNVIQRVVAAFA